MFTTSRNKENDPHSFSKKDKVQKKSEGGIRIIVALGGEFTVLGKIGSGRHSRVYLCHNRSSIPNIPTRLAIKRSIFEITEVMSAYKQIDFSLGLNDPNLVNTYHVEAVTNEGRMSLSTLMECMDINLDTVIKRRATEGHHFLENEIISIVLALASALSYLHSRSPPVAHRAIHPQNVLLRRGRFGPGAFKVCDFGCATTEAFYPQNSGEIQTYLGEIGDQIPFACRPPEMVSPVLGQRVDEQVDIWGFGVLLYNLLYLTPPFPENSFGEIGAYTEPRHPVTLYSRPLCFLMRQCLEPDPNVRWDIFGLIDFLRTSELAEHIGIFCFTETERPPGQLPQPVGGNSGLPAEVGIARHRLPGPPPQPERRADEPPPPRGGGARRPPPRKSLPPPPRGAAMGVPARFSRTTRRIFSSPGGGAEPPAPGLAIEDLFPSGQEFESAGGPSRPATLFPAEFPAGLFSPMGGGNSPGRDLFKNY